MSSFTWDIILIWLFLQPHEVVFFSSYPFRDFCVWPPFYSMSPKFILCGLEVWDYFCSFVLKISWVSPGKFVVGSQVLSTLYAPPWCREMDQALCFSEPRFSGRQCNMGWASLDPCGYTEASAMATNVWWLLLFSTYVVVPGLPQWQKAHQGVFVWFSSPVFSSLGKQASPIAACRFMGVYLTVSPCLHWLPDRWW